MAMLPLREAMSETDCNKDVVPTRKLLADMNGKCGCDDRICGGSLEPTCLRREVQWLRQQNAIAERRFEGLEATVRRLSLEMEALRREKETAEARCRQLAVPPAALVNQAPLLLQNRVVRDTWPSRDAVDSVSEGSLAHPSSLMNEGRDASLTAVERDSKVAHPSVHTADSPRRDSPAPIPHQGTRSLGPIIGSQEEMAPSSFVTEPCGQEGSPEFELDSMRRSVDEFARQLQLLKLETEVTVPGTPTSSDPDQPFASRTGSGADVGGALLSPTAGFRAVCEGAAVQKCKLADAVSENGTGDRDVVGAAEVLAREAYRLGERPHGDADAELLWEVQAFKAWLDFTVGATVELLEERDRDPGFLVEDCRLRCLSDSDGVRGDGHPGAPSPKAWWRRSPTESLVERRHRGKWRRAWRWVSKRSPGDGRMSGSFTN